MHNVPGRKPENSAKYEFVIWKINKPKRHYRATGIDPKKIITCHVLHAPAVKLHKGVARIQKQVKMKLSNSLLAAIVVGVVLQSTVSCTKDKDSVKDKEHKESKSTPAPGNCPGCGMG